jgi:hypothetical protein
VKGKRAQVVMPGLAPGIHAEPLHFGRMEKRSERLSMFNGPAWMAGTSPAMTVRSGGPTKLEWKLFLRFCKLPFHSLDRIRKNPLFSCI